MPQEIYNEGRVVGLSAWELYMREALGNGVSPEDIPNENQWLTSMIGSGSSMILKIPANTSAGVHNYELPLGSNLSAAGVIVASPFLGDCEFDLSGWAKKVISYSPLIQNTSSDYPTSNNVPYDSNYDNSVYKDSVSEFVKITDGIVYTKNANWIDTGNNVPEKDIDPNFNSSATVVRLYLNSTTRYDVLVLLTGFTNKRILQGLSGFAVEESGHSVGGSTDTDSNDWKNGGMIGPEIIPWASKIIFTVPSSAYNLANYISRKVPSDSTFQPGTKYGYKFVNVNGPVKTNSLIDLDTIDVTDYYTNHSSDFSKDPKLQENINDVTLGLSDSFNSLVALYPGMTATQIKSLSDNSLFFPPALYAAQVTATGNKSLVPMDTAAPGTVKGFRNSTQAAKYITQMPDNFAVYHNPTNNTFSFAISNTAVNNWPGTAKITFLTAPKATLTAGTVNADFIALSDSNGNKYGTTGTAGTTTATAANRGKLTWDNLLSALVANNTYDLVGDRVRAFAAELDSNKIGTAANNTITEVKSTKVTTDTVTFKSGTTAEMNVTTAYQNADTTKYVTLPSDSSIQVGKNYIKFGNGLKLFIQTSEPSTVGVEVGSIGIGW